jgi:hypothetical protein
MCVNYSGKTKTILQDCLCAVHLCTNANVVAAGRGVEFIIPTVNGVADTSSHFNADALRAFVMEMQSAFFARTGTVPCSNNRAARRLNG